MNTLYTDLQVLAKRIPSRDDARFVKEALERLKRESRVVVLREALVLTLRNRYSLRDDSLWLWCAYRLAELKSPAAAKALVSVLDEPNLPTRWDAGDGEGMAIAITQLGKVALPVLERTQSPLGKTLAADIRAGKVHS